ncbi:hypothetical protein PUN28_017328 [Cardiocondyla obscurior]|uniref:Uncharacterized protein n=1 Tax=Cardiocondyla obscurior TaxID=286306 RepID=A0AAW2EQ71_9HYME
MKGRGIAGARACTRACGVYTCVVTVTVPQNKPARFSIRMHSLGRDEVIMKSLPLPSAHLYSPARLLARSLACYLPSSLRNAHRRVSLCFPITQRLFSIPSMAFDRFRSIIYFLFFFSFFLSCYSGQDQQLIETA